MLTEAEPRNPSRQSLADLERLAGLIQTDDPELRKWFAEFCRTHRGRLAADLDIIESHVKAGSRVLEYGAVPLLMTAAISHRGYAVSALDLAPDRFRSAIARLDLDVRRCDVEHETVPFAADSFDAILFNELFEHLRINPIFALREAQRVLKPGGLLLLSTPNLRSLRGIRNLLFRHHGHASSGGVYEQYEKLEKLGHMGHVREYTAKEIADFLARVGFRVDKVIFRGGYGAGLVGLAERVAPGLRPFFSIIATKRTASEEEAAPTA